MFIIVSIRGQFIAGWPNSSHTLQRLWGAFKCNLFGCLAFVAFAWWDCDNSAFNRSTVDCEFSKAVAFCWHCDNAVFNCCAVDDCECSTAVRRHCNCDNSVLNCGIRLFWFSNSVNYERISNNLHIQIQILLLSHITWICKLSNEAFSKSFECWRSSISSCLLRSVCNQSNAVLLELVSWYSCCLFFWVADVVVDVVGVELSSLRNNRIRLERSLDRRHWGQVKELKIFYEIVEVRKEGIN